ncbi:hypothetical protein CONPUDRAFT_88151 [Coniophora puteana RWD-64-598 SS2]|uniref:Zn(2)-C6 fungal-type domain-containing protein n=1 Tax=Coniophora puteana (strain RWD-64-598) TaxID=741705 RepID=A0A5M3MWV0_CONPW|nr:uncharacterized protein CONPUDRAFT_88151 [Coniophora puteana RWD-64-598 SS2]EIW83618.1 hypothetical protein CONPUDRAFT_88151 [Coniophora puteana RWD-64-598 SS2]
MGGDHKCPVCQATFTRPQHVARHMRSHTGDRPYKCQYCGDQFARSDLLSRHVNKCHANEKPTPNASNARRKGSASLSRATTSKQACDQCVQTSLPCDGCNPCSKCVQRKSRCTYVKFHRQTAPSGPGHHAARPASSSGLLPGARLSSNLDEFMLAPPPVGVPGVNGNDLFQAPYGFNNVYSQPQSDLSHLPLSMASDADMAVKYRAQAELLRRAGSSMLGQPGVGASGLYSNPSANMSQPAMSTNWFNWDDGQMGHDGSGRFQQFDGQDHFQFQDGGGSVGSAYRARRPSFDFSDTSSTHSHSLPSSATSSNINLPLTSDMYQHGADDYAQQQQRLERMAIGDERRPPSQHGGGFDQQGQQQSMGDNHNSSRLGEGGFFSAFGLMSIDDPNVLAGLSTDGAPFFSNAAMINRPHSPNATPMPPKPPSQQGQGVARLGERGGLSNSQIPLPTPGANRDAETRELRDFWKAYMRTPLSGPHAAVDMVPLTPGGGGRRRVRVSSLPSVKTPTVERLPNIGGGGQGQQETSGMRTTLHGNPEDLRSYEAAVNARNAALKLNLVPRKRNTTGGRAASSASPPIPGENGFNGIGIHAGGSMSMSPPNHAALAAQQQQMGYDYSRPSSSSSTSSLAHAFGQGTSLNGVAHLNGHGPGPGPGLMKMGGGGGANGMQIPSIHTFAAPPQVQMSQSYPHHSSSMLHHHFGSGHNNNGISEVSRESSVGSSDGGGSGGSGSGGSASGSGGSDDMTRPAFKRLASQTLVPVNSKRAMLDGGISEHELEGEMPVGSVPNARLAGPDLQGQGGGGGGGLPPLSSRPIAALPERARRGSEAQSVGGLQA